MKVTAMGMHAQPELGGVDRYFHELAATMGDRMDGCVIQNPEEPLRERWKFITRTLGDRLYTTTPLASHFALYAYPLRKRLRSIPHIVHFHGPWAAESRLQGAKPWVVWAKKQIERAVYRTGDRFIVLSSAFKRILIEDYGIDEERIRVIPGGVFSERYATGLSRTEARAKLGWPNDGPIVICVRRLTPRTGVQNLIEAWARVIKNHPTARLMIGGTGPMANDLLLKVQSMGLQNSLILLGFVPDEDLPVAYRAANFSIVPTVGLEGFGLITLESMAAGTPVLVTPVGGLPDTVGQLSRDLILESNTVEALEKGLNAALAGTITLPDQETCQRFVREHFDWSVIAPQIWSVYEEAAALYSSGS